MEWLEKIIESIEKGNYFFMFVILLFLVITNIEKILAVFEDLHNKKVQRLEAYLENKFIGDMIKGIIKDQLDSYIFKAATGIRADKFMQSKILELYEKANGKFTLQQLSRVSHYMDSDDGKIAIKITAFDTFVYYFHFILLIGTGLVALFFWMGLWFFNEIDKTYVTLWIISGAYFLLFLYTLYEVMKFRLAKKLQIMFQELQDNNETA